jgi:hypothetical protein
LYKKSRHKIEFGHAQCVEWFKSIYTKFSLLFLDIDTCFYEFWILHYFLRIKSIENDLKFVAQCRAEFGPGLQSSGVAACHARPAERLPGLGLASRSSHGVAHVLRARWRRGHRALVDGPGGS